MLLDFLSKTLSSIVSAKTASITLIACLSIVTLWNKGVLLIKNCGVKDDYVFYLLILILYSTSHIVVVGFIKFWACIEKALSKRKLSINNRESLEAFRNLAKKAIPHLPASQIEILKNLSKREQTLGIGKDGTLYLEQQNYIKRLHKVSGNSFVFEINPIVMSELLNYLRPQRAVMLEEFVENITEDEKKFLTLFFSDIVSEGTRNSGRKMESNIFRSGEGMARNNLLVHFTHTSKTSNNESFRLTPDTAEILKKKVFNKKHIRNEIQLDSDFIYAAHSSGGGATGGGAIGNM